MFDFPKQAELNRPLTKSKIYEFAKPIGGILQGINVAVFSQYKMNPEDFMRKAARLINEQKATVIVEHLAYNPVDESYTEDIFTRPRPKEDLTKGFQAKRHIYDYVFTDSQTERKFVTDLDSDASDVVVYAKLPRAFLIPTPVGNYNPDWAIAFKQGAVKSTSSPKPKAPCRQWN